ncbi:2-keto-4-pentenoate hydratase [Streptomyces sp. NPDC015125]|uniref:2-keto-4-pentenoate hydratase n=1 Tax=Streptomyces sp. NPDC015125 TaxID=3364938 RepID=UPI003701AAE7
MTSDALQDIAANLYHAHRTGKPVPSAVRDGSLSSRSDAYEIQWTQLRQRVSDNDPLRGFKAGLVSVTAQRNMDTSEPVLGHLTDSMFPPSHIPLGGKFIRPLIEPALAFVLGEPLRGPGVTVADAVRAVDCVLPALEITDSGFEDGPASVLDLVADNAGCRGVVLGGTPAALSDVDLRLSGCVLYRNGEVAATGAGGMALGSPVNALVWVANAVRQEGFALTAGSVVLVPCLTPAVALEPGDTVTASIAEVGAVTTVRAR